jgi:hypothetical protein
MEVLSDYGVWARHGHRSLSYGHRRIFVYLQGHTYVEERAECHLNNTNIFIRLETAYRPLAGQKRTTLSRSTWSGVFHMSDTQQPSTHLCVEK